MQHEDLTRRSIAAAMKVHSTLGNGFQEVIYQRALEIEFPYHNLAFEREKEMSIHYRGHEIGDFLGTVDSTHLEHGVALRSDGSTLRELHALLKAKDPSFGFGGLVCVMNKRQEFLWVYEKFAGEY